MAVIKQVYPSMLCQRVSSLTDLTQQGALAVNLCTTCAVMPTLSRLIRLQSMRVNVCALESLKLRTCRA